ncbi:hypothetical protein ABZ297_22990 [Nonomuraea sp. NPDC005983]|uniref:hypothetical protein n=1 Tax=Nonomuraea sp. NPDC005983 TaxID=3155595 RepID=UPI0033B974F9
MIITLAASLAGCSAITHVTGLDCIGDPAEGDWGKAVQRESVLHTPPVSATPDNTDVDEGPYVSAACMDDNRIAEVGRLYKFTGPPTDITAYYKRKAQAAGWHLTEDGAEHFVRRPGSTEKWPSNSCFSKDLGEFTADFELAFDYWSLDAQEDPSTKRYWVEISFSPTGGNCRNIPREERVWPG